MKIIIPDKEKFEKLKNNIKRQGYDNLHILADFDRTLTYEFVDGNRVPSIISMLRDGKHLTKDYAKKAHALFDKYHPIETDPNIPVKEKKKAMLEWWDTHFKLLIDCGLSKSDLEDIVYNGIVQFRKGIEEFIDLLNNNNIPIIILSASGCGDAIQMYFQKIKKDYPNIHIVTNRFNWDENGKAISVKKPIIHSMNKDETILKDIPQVYKEIKNRKNVILLGDSPGDLGMITGFDYDNLLTIGFLNSKIDELIDSYSQNYDVILQGDGDIIFLNNLIKNLLN